MRIASIDNSAAERVGLQKLIEKAYHECRDTLGHVSFPLIFPTTKDELLVNSAPDILVFGSGFSVERVLSLAKELKPNLEKTRFCFFLTPENYTLRNLQRLEPVSQSIFSTSDSLVRVVHTLVSHSETKSASLNGKLIVVSGVKGGVGATSVVAGLVHAAQAIGKKAVVLDLSEKSVFAVYMGCRKTQSSDYSAVLRDNILIDRSFINKCIAESANGVSVFLPPAGGPEIRELWLRDPQRAEISISIVEMLLEIFDLVIVDKASAEGLFPYALTCRAASRILVTSNDPASIHLLNIQLQDLFDMPGGGRNKVLLNLLDQRGLGKKELINILRFQTGGGRDDLDLAVLSYDARARNWVGTGNTFFTESSTVTQTLLEEMAFALSEQGLSAKAEEFKIFQVVKRILRIPEFFSRSANRPKLLTFERKKNLAATKPTEVVKPLELTPVEKVFAEQKPIEEKIINLVAAKETLVAEVLVREDLAQQVTELLYQPPVRRIGG